MNEKLIKLKKVNEGEAIVHLQNWIIKTTNAGLISISINSLCKKFIKDLKKIPLSDELQ